MLDILELKKLKLENFQSLRAKADIPLRPLTFLYGPNSAGKSAISDALYFIDTILKGSRKNIEDCIKRWQHTKGDGEALPPMKVEVDFIRDRIFERENHDDVDLPIEFNSDISIKNFTNLSSKTITLSIISDQGGEDTQSSNNNIEVCLAINEIPLLRISQPFDDPHKLWLNPSHFGDALLNLAIRHGFENPDLYNFECFCSIENNPFTIVGLNSTEQEARRYSLNRDIVSIANYFLSRICHETFSPKVIAADRPLIEKSAHSVFCTHESNFGQGFLGFKNHSSIWGLSNKNFIDAPGSLLEKFSDAHQSALAEISASFLHEVALKRINELAKDKPDVYGDPRQASEIQRLQTLREEIINSFASSSGLETCMSENSKTQRLPIHEFINHCLCDHLFLEQGYKISFEFCEILASEKKWLEGHPPQIYKSESGELNYRLSALVVCTLIDNFSRRFTFQDVGSGLSCILPVLLSLYGKKTFLHQPELHLHPALQSALGDIFVEVAKNFGCCHFVETHSEYILLRCLRRIRETTLGKHIVDSSLSLTRDDLAVIYFDPRLDGSTEVRNIRVSSHGDFIDRWPRGFFEERGKDLFDE